MSLAEDIIKIWREYHRRTSVLRKRAQDAIRYAEERGYTARFAREVLDELEKIHLKEQDILARRVERELEESKQTTLETIGVNARMRR